MQIFCIPASMKKDDQGDPFQSYFPMLMKKQNSSACININPDPRIWSSGSALSCNCKHMCDCLEERSLCVWPYSSLIQLQIGRNIKDPFTTDWSLKHRVRGFEGWKAYFHN